MDTYSFTVDIKTDGIYKDIAENVETRIYLEIMSWKDLPKGKNKKVIGLMKDKVVEKIMKSFVELRAKTYSYLISDGSEDKKAKDIKKCVIKRKLKFDDYKNCLEATQLVNQKAI